MDTRVLMESDVHWIVQIFLESRDLLQTRIRLFHSMGLTMSQMEDIRIEVANSRSQSYGFFTSGLIIWIYNNGTDATIGKLIEVLQNEELNSVADQILEELPERGGYFSNEALPLLPVSSPVWFNVPVEVYMFTGRQEEMERLHKSIMRQNVAEHAHNGMTMVTTLSGLGGIGKTALAVHYAWEYFTNNFYFNVIWINGETAEAVEKSFHGLADKVGLNKIGTNGLTVTLIELAYRIYEYFDQTVTLFVFDNVEEYENVKLYLPIKSPKTTRQYVLITSRSTVWNQKTDLIVLNVFPENDSVGFFRSYLKLETDEEIEFAKRIAHELQNFPLAIRQAGAYIKNACSDNSQTAARVMKHYLELLQTNSKQVLNFKGDSYEKTIISTWKITMNKIKHQNYLAVRIMRIMSYFNSDNIPIKLLENIPKKKYFDRVWDSMIYKNSTINESSVLESVKLLSQFSMVTMDSQFNISILRLVQKVIRNDVELTSGQGVVNIRRYLRRAILSETVHLKCAVIDDAIRTVETPLRSSPGSDYEMNCLLHAISVCTHIESNQLRDHYEQFIAFVNSKQTNLIDTHIPRLVVFLEEKKYYEAEKSFYETRDKYFGNSEGNILNESFTAKFVHCVCLTITNLIASYLRSESQILSELCSKLLIGFKLPLGGWEYLRDFQKTADLLKSTIDHTDLTHNIQYSHAGTAAQMYGIIFDYFKTGLDYMSVCDNFVSAIDCFAYLERWTEILKMVESIHELAIDWSEAGNGESVLLYLSKALQRIGEIIGKINHETSDYVRSKLFQLTLKIYNEYYIVFRNNEKHILTLECGRGRIECLTHLNRQKGILEVIGDMKLVVDLLNKTSTIVGEYQLFKITVSVMEYSNDSSCKEIKTDLLDFAAVIFEVIFESCLSKRTYNVFFLDTVISLLKCLTQLYRPSEITKIGKQLMFFLDTISGVKLDDEFRHLNNAISLIENSPDCKTFNPTEFILQIYKFSYKSGIQLKNYDLIEGGMNGILNCLAELDKRHKITLFTDDLKAFLVTIVREEYYGYFIRLLDSIFQMSKHPSCEVVRIELLKNLLRSYQLIYRYSSRSSFFSDMTESGIGILNSLADLDDYQIILETVSGITGNIINYASLQTILDVSKFFDSLLEISKHPNSVSLKYDLLGIALTNYKQFYDRCKESESHPDISNCMKGILTYLIELNQTPLFIQYVYEEFMPYLETVPDQKKSDYYNIIQIIENIRTSGFIVE